NSLCGQNSGCESVRPFKEIIWSNVSEFESHMPSQLVASLWSISGPQKYARHARELDGRRAVSNTWLSQFLASTGQFWASVSGRHFSISVWRGQRPGSRSLETGSLEAADDRPVSAQRVRALPPHSNFS